MPSSRSFINITVHNEFLANSSFDKNSRARRRGVRASSEVPSAAPPPDDLVSAPGPTPAGL